MTLPIHVILPELCDSIAHTDCIITAPPGAGKSTFLPLKLLALNVFKDKQILLLQPRQVAVRSIAHFLASQLNEKVGDTIGYQMRGESAISSNTRLCVITEALLTSKIQQDPELNNIGLIIFDEFHERSLHSDIALGLSLELQAGLRNDLRLLVMSATLNTEQVKRVLPLAKVLVSEGRSYPIDYVYQPLNKNSQFPHNALEISVIKAIEQALQDQQGHILVFLPGAGIINKIQKRLGDKLDTNTVLYPLYGGLSTEQQKNAINIPVQGKRKVVLATNIAETSLTIDGVNIVIDSGREKVQRLNLSRKANQLSEQLISKASSIQRAGRAGRQQAGVCYRLWSEQQQQTLAENTTAQIYELDLSQSLLTLLEWGTSFEDLPLIDKPRDAQINYANDVLFRLSLVDEQGALTALGKKAATFQTHPRLAKLLCIASFPDFYNTDFVLEPSVVACVVALIEGKPIKGLSTKNKHEEALNNLDIVQQSEFVIDALINNKSKSIHDIQKEIKRLAKKLKIRDLNHSLRNIHNLAEQIAQILILTFPDKLGLQRQGQTYSLVDGTGVEFPHTQHQQFTHTYPTWIICTQSQITQSANSTIRQYCSVPENTINDYLAANQQSHLVQSWDNKLKKVQAKKVVSIGNININAQACRLTVSNETTKILVKQIRLIGLSSLLQHSKSTFTLLNRVQIAKQIDKEHVSNFPDLSIEHLSATLETWLQVYLSEAYSWQHLLELNWHNIIQSLLTWQQLQYLDEYFPSHINVPSGSKHKLDYSNESDRKTSVNLAVRMQELYGWQQTPSVGKNQMPITISILSPAHREIQKTSDLAGFWCGSYKDVQKEMKGRYPRHFWPDDPVSAKATTKTKKKM